MQIVFSLDSDWKLDRKEVMKATRKGKIRLQTCTNNKLQ